MIIRIYPSTTHEIDTWIKVKSYALIICQLFNEVSQQNENIFYLLKSVIIWIKINENKIWCC